jgi:hypothetical protein
MIRSGLSDNDKLLFAVIEQLKLPLTQIALQSELSKLQNTDSYSEIKTIAAMAINLIDSYLIGVEGSNMLAIEPVSLSSVLYDAASNVSDITRKYNCEILVDLPVKLGPVMADKSSLEAAFTMLGHSFVEAQADTERTKPPLIVLTAYRTVGGMTAAGVFSSDLVLSKTSLRRAYAILGGSRQPLPGFSQTTASGIFVADKILGNVSTNLKVAHHAKRSGLIATFAPSKQLELIK